MATTVVDSIESVSPSSNAQAPSSITTIETTIDTEPEINDDTNALNNANLNYFYLNLVVGIYSNIIELIIYSVL